MRCVPDIAELHNAITKVAVKWKLIGSQLKIKQEVLDQIEHDFAVHGSLRQCIEVVKTWQKHLYPEFTWATFINVLKQDCIGEHALAKSLSEQILSTLNTY